MKIIKSLMYARYQNINIRQLTKVNLEKTILSL